MKCMARHRQRGAALIWSAVAMIGLIGITGLAIDWAYVLWTGEKMQTAADAAALAAAQKLHEGDAAAREAAVQYASAYTVAGTPIAIHRNDAPGAPNDPAGDVVIGHYDRESQVFQPTLTNPNAVRVRARHTEQAHGPVELLFGPMFGKHHADVARYAIAMTAPLNDAGIVVLKRQGRERFVVRGAASLDLGEAAIHINSSHARAAGVLQGAVHVEGSAINAQGGVAQRGRGAFDGPVNTGITPIDDPLTHLPAPDHGPTHTADAIQQSGTYQPGYYPDGLHLSSADVTLEPGVYVLGDGFSAHGQVDLTAKGVMFYLKQGEVRVNGNARLNLSPPQSGPYAGISFFQARANQNHARFNGTERLGGAGDKNYAGLFYFPNASLEVGGTGDTLIGQLIAAEVEVFGAGQLIIDDNATAPNASREVMLVE